MRITLLIEENRMDDAAIVLETLGFVPEVSIHPEAPKDGCLKVTGEFPEKALAELEAVAGVRDWFTPSSEDVPLQRAWPWGQMPETD